MFVLGAGSSIPYGLQLIHGISTRNQDPEYRKQIVDCGFDENHLLEFINKLGKCGANSIATFLEKNKDYLEIGKLCIAQVTVPRVL